MKLDARREALLKRTFLDYRQTSEFLENPLVFERAEGAYYWEVQSIDKSGRESMESEKNRFTIIRKGPENTSIALELSPFIQHGHVLEIKGKTEPTARVMVNGQEVPVVGNDGGFQFFTAPLPAGENIITVTAQNSKGGVRTMQERVVIQ